MVVLRSQVSLAEHSRLKKKSRLRICLGTSFKVFGFSFSLSFQASCGKKVAS